MARRYRNLLFLSDLQMPFEAQYSLKFSIRVKKEYNISDDDVYNVGDEIDAHFGGMWDKDPDALHTPNSELYECKQKLLAWYRAFPKMKICTSNHGLRWAKKAFKAGIPSQMIVPYQKLIEAPKEWRWKDHWVTNTKCPWYVFHGMGYSGMYAARTAALDNGMNTVFGHLHSSAAIMPIVTRNKQIYGMNVGCLIDTEAYAFHYGKDNRWKPWLGVGVVVDDGRYPILIPYDGGK
jgi:hypothetical protein